jgi:hypothetical protein
MKKRFILIFMMTTLAVQAQENTATTSRKTFSRTTSVSTVIDASVERIWQLLTTSSDFSRWNSTVISLQGNIAKGEKIQLKSTLDSNRVFKLKVKEFRPNEYMLWGSGAAPFFKGKRTYLLSKDDQGKVRFTMTERLSGIMFPMAASHIPSFDANFTQFAADLKQEAEKTK